MLFILKHHNMKTQSTYNQTQKFYYFNDSNVMNHHQNILRNNHTNNNSLLNTIKKLFTK